MSTYWHIFNLKEVKKTIRVTLALPSYHKLYKNVQQYIIKVGKIERHKSRKTDVKKVYVPWTQVTKVWMKKFDDKKKKIVWFVRVIYLFQTYMTLTYLQYLHRNCKRRWWIHCKQMNCLFPSTFTRQWQT